MANNRLGRVEEEIKKIISDIIQNNLKNPKVTGIVSVTGVEVTADMKYATVYISVLDLKNEKNETVDALSKSKGFIRKELAGRINLRYTPELIFKPDNSISYGAHIDDLLKKVLPKEDSK